MQPRHVLLAVVLSVFWGLNFVVITVALTDFPPLFLGGLRFAHRGAASAVPAAAGGPLAHADRHRA